MNRTLTLIILLAILISGCVGPPAIPEPPAPPITPPTQTPSSTAPPVETPVPPTEAPVSTPTATQPSGILQVHFIDVGQGDSILIETPNHEAILIDGGDNNKGNIISSYIASEGIEDIDIMIATHPHADHIGGLDTVMASIPVNAVWDNGEQRTTRTYLDYIALAKARKYSVVGRGNSTVLDGVIIEVLAPRQPLIFSNVNDNSVVVRATYGEVDFLFMGDCEADCEQDILNSGLLIDSEILKVGHHGSRTSTSLAFLSAVSPEIAVISVGENNRYGHPHQETLDKLSSNGIIYYRTDLHGTIIVETNGTSYWVITEREATTATTPPPTTQPSQTTEPAETTPLPTTKTNVEICQVIYDPPGQEPDEEMIKLCNRGSYSIDIGGWILTDGEGSYTIPMGTTISAGGSWTVYGSTYNPTGYTRGLYLNNKHDEVLLYDAGGSLVDVYSW